MTEIHYAEKYNNMQDQTQYPIVFFGFVDSFQKVSYEKYFEQITTKTEKIDFHCFCFIKFSVIISRSKCVTIYQELVQIKHIDLVVILHYNSNWYTFIILVVDGSSWPLCPEDHSVDRCSSHR